MTDQPSVTHQIRSRFDRLLATGTASFGPHSTAMWMASLDTRTGRYPADDTRPPHIPRRDYRAIDAPRGCSLYWDQPALLAAYALSERIGSGAYARAADRYLADFLARCIWIKYRSRYEDKWRLVFGQ